VKGRHKHKNEMCLGLSRSIPRLKLVNFFLSCFRGFYLPLSLFSPSILLQFHLHQRVERKKSDDTPGRETWNSLGKFFFRVPSIYIRIGTSKRKTKVIEKSCGLSVMPPRRIHNERGKKKLDIRWIREKRYMCRLWYSTV